MNRLSSKTDLPRDEEQVVIAEVALAKVMMQRERETVGSSFDVIVEMDGQKIKEFKTTSSSL